MTKNIMYNEIKQNIRKFDMKIKSRYIAFLLVIFLLISSFFSCTGSQKEDEQKGEEPGEENLPDDTDDGDEPTSTEVFFDNDAGWLELFCYLYNEKDEFLCEAQFACDIHGIYSTVIPPECAYFVFTDKDDNRTELLYLPTDGRNVYNNKSNEWVSYNSAIKNVINVGGNLVSVTKDDLDNGYEYYVFLAEKDGVYSFSTESDFEIYIVSTEISSGDWSPASEDWTTFTPMPTESYLTAGSYYVCLFNSKITKEGLYDLTLKYEEREVDDVSLDGMVFSSGEIYVYFYKIEDDVMTLLAEDGKTYNYKYSVVGDAADCKIQLILPAGAEENYFGLYSLSSLSRAGEVTYKDGILKIKNNEFLKCSAD